MGVRGKIKLRVVTPIKRRSPSASRKRTSVAAAAKSPTPAFKKSPWVKNAKAITKGARVVPRRPKSSRFPMSSKLQLGFIAVFALHHTFKNQLAHPLLVNQSSFFNATTTPISEGNDAAVPLARTQVQDTLTTAMIPGNHFYSSSLDETGKSTLLSENQGNLLHSWTSQLRSSRASDAMTIDPIQSEDGSLSAMLSSGIESSLREAGAVSGRLYESTMVASSEALQVLSKSQASIAQTANAVVISTQDVLTSVLPARTSEEESGSVSQSRQTQRDDVVDGTLASPPSSLQWIPQGLSSALFTSRPEPVITSKNLRERTESLLLKSKEAVSEGSRQLLFRLPPQAAREEPQEKDEPFVSSEPTTTTPKGFRGRVRILLRKSKQALANGSDNLLALRPKGHGRRQVRVVEQEPEEALNSTHRLTFKDLRSQPRRLLRHAKEAMSRQQSRKEAIHLTDEVTAPKENKRPLRQLNQAFKAMIGKSTSPGSNQQQGAPEGLAPSEGKNGKGRLRAKILLNGWLQGSTFEEYVGR